MGGAESGVGAAVLAKVKGLDVFLSDNGEIKPEYKETLDKWGIDYEEGSDTEEKTLAADEIIKRASITSSVPSIKKIEE